MKKLFIFFVCAFFSINLFAVETEGYVITSQTGGRYEIIQSNIKRSLLFRLDKYTGDVFQFVKTESEAFPYLWQKIEIIGNREGDAPNTINYQLFLGGISAADCFLLNINTGRTFKLYEDKDTKELFFSWFF